MLTAYVTALGTQSSAATIPVTLAQTLRLGVRPQLASFVVPLCATIHLSGSMMKIVACALAVSMLGGLDIPAGTFAGFILLLGVTMIAAPGCRAVRSWRRWDCSSRCSGSTRRLRG